MLNTKTDRKYWEDAVTSLFIPKYAGSVIAGEAELNDMENKMVTDEISYAVTKDIEG